MLIDSDVLLNCGVLCDERRSPDMVSVFNRSDVSLVLRHYGLNAYCAGYRGGNRVEVQIGVGNIASCALVYFRVFRAMHMLCQYKAVSLNRCSLYDADEGMVLVRDKGVLGLFMDHLNSASECVKELAAIVLSPLSQGRVCMFSENNKQLISKFMDDFDIRNVPLFVGAKLPSTLSAGESLRLILERRIDDSMLASANVGSELHHAMIGEGFAVAMDPAPSSKCDVAMSFLCDQVNVQRV